MLENTKIINYLLVTGCFIAINLSFYVDAQECSSNDDDAGYMGSISVTSSNKPCQMWKSLSDSSAFEFVDSIEDSGNFCRNPKGENKKEKAYCFTNIQTREWEYCTIPKCSGCSKVHGISYGSIQFINRQLYDDGSYQPGSKILFKCRPYFAVYDSTSGPLEWNCGNNGKWSSNKLPKCLWRGFIESTPNCWYYSADNFYPNSKPRRLYYDTKNTANGTQCINWTKFVNKFKNKDFPQEGKTNAKNYCRSPGDFEPKCPISKTSLKKCGIKQCTGCSGIPYVKYTSYDIDYIPNTLENTMEAGSTVNYRCSAGTLIGNSNITCVNGKWEGGLPYCSLKYCSKPPPTPDNSYVSNKRFVYANIEDYAKEYLLFDQSTYKFVCKPNYKFEDESVTELVYQCNSGEWTFTGKNSKCVLESRNIPIPQAYCPLPENIENGYRAKYNLFKAGPNQYYGEFEIACNTGYKMIGNPKVACMNGSWTTYPKCTLLPSCSFDILYKPAENVKIITSNLLYSADNSGISVGSFVQYECLPNYFPEISQDDLRAKCLENGQWSTKIPVRCVMQ
ncbi:unnamed protein product [Brachionus calyciflorus]|uniref:Uncharacterized protein n=1 Tax=Brachionus calyciflorus TaxID=104777 RepID=A0A813M0C6_9BILA|nr:unnamed protein product [Brachionus calyciflorus]